MRQQTTHKKPAVLMHIINQYWLILILLMVLTTLIYQNFVINQFPVSLAKKQHLINVQIQHNQALNLQNKAKALELKALTSTDMERVESEARQRFGLIKDGETYYQITHE